MSKLIKNAKPEKKGFITMSREGGESQWVSNTTTPTETASLDAGRIRKNDRPATAPYGGTREAVFEFGIQVVFSAVAIGLIVLFNRM